jgi:low affinity Fe/Cu permease
VIAKRADDLRGAVEQVAADLNATGDARVHAFVATQLSPGLGCGTHPNVAQHQMLGLELPAELATRAPRAASRGGPRGEVEGTGAAHRRKGGLRVARDPTIGDVGYVAGEMSNDGPKRSWFTRFAKTTSHFVGRAVAFSVAASAIISWSACGLLFGFSDTWQLVIDTSTTIVTFLMLFLIQNTQVRDSEAIQVKLDELIRVDKGANPALLDLEELDLESSTRTLDAMREPYERLGRDARNEQRQREPSASSEPD